MTLRIDHSTAAGTFSLDGETHEVENNIWVIGTDDQCVVIDAPHDIDAVKKVVDGREVLALLLTHAHDDHVRFAPELAQELEAAMLLHPDDEEVWKLTHGDLEWDEDLQEGSTFTLDDTEIFTLHTPGHSPGSVCFYIPSQNVLFSGDTLFEGGPGATGRSFSSREQIEETIQRRLFTLPRETTVNTGHGPSTTIGAEIDAAKKDGWLKDD
ncbi:MBL fold metallo-hydrolase [Helcobacillus massiliensis]|uniref:S-(Hydroxymethyl)mycothiol dehydrogenase n=1 Tax=Helcobacillus massiliensis TaxID=521392 RepID=A0A839QPI8_9MICO|nr:MBL fold metallo-hydrolase [Helcobacillus massiliensis]MBB3021892.1 S-(hydroxymethyl)mycothiol dehydrogenase [Helcobacillus massiliensis]